MIERKEYLDMLLRWKDKQVIKVITGIRRCGKSTLMEMFQQRGSISTVTYRPDRCVAISPESIYALEPVGFTIRLC